MTVVMRADAIKGTAALSPFVGAAPPNSHRFRWTRSSPGFGTSVPVYVYEDTVAPVSRRLLANDTLPARQVTRVAVLDGAKDATGALTLANTHVSGTVPKQSASGGPSAGADEMVRIASERGLRVFRRLADVPGCEAVPEP